MGTLNELKVAAMLLRKASETAEHTARERQVPELMDASLAFDTLSVIAGALADAPYMFRGDQVMTDIRTLLTSTAGMDDLYDEGQDDE